MINEKLCLLLCLLTSAPAFASEMKVQKQATKKVEANRTPNSIEAAIRIIGFKTAVENAHGTLEVYLTPPNIKTATYSSICFHWGQVNASLRLAQFDSKKEVFHHRMAKIMGVQSLDMLCSFNTDLNSLVATMTPAAHKEAMEYLKTEITTLEKRIREETDAP